MAKYVPAKGGNEFDGITGDLDKDSPESMRQLFLRNTESPTEHKTRDFLVRFSMWTFLAALVSTGVYGMLVDNWDPVKAVWMVSGAPLGVIFTWYFGGFDGKNM